MNVGYAWSSNIAGAPGGTSPYRVIVSYFSGTGSSSNSFNHSQKSGSYSYYSYVCSLFTKGSNAMAATLYVQKRRKGGVYYFKDTAYSQTLKININ